MSSAGFVIHGAGAWLQGSARLGLGGLTLALTVLALERVWVVTKSVHRARDPERTETDFERQAGNVALGAMAAFFWAGTLMFGWILFEGYRPGSVSDLGSPWVQVLIVGLTVACAAYATFVTVQWRRALKGA